MATTRALSQVAVQLQSGATYEENALFVLPETGYKFMQKTGLIEDDSYQGVAFKDTPQKGVIDTSGSISCNVDVVSLPAYLAAVTGYVSSGSYYFDGNGNTYKLSVARKDGVSYKRYANVYIKNFKLSGAADSLIAAELELLGVTSESKTALGNYPSTTGAGEAFSFHEMSGSGFFRVGDQADALASGDNLEIEDFSFEIVTGFDAQHINSYNIMTPEFGMVRPDVTGSFKIPKHAADTFIDWRDNVTKLQLSATIYKSATAQLSVTIPNFVIDTELSDDELVKQGITMKIGRNGVGTNYVNTNVSNNSPIIFTIVNS